MSCCRRVGSIGSDEPGRLHRLLRLVAVLARLLSSRSTHAPCPRPLHPLLLFCRRPVTAATSPLDYVTNRNTEARALLRRPPRTAKVAVLRRVSRARDRSSVPDRQQTRSRHGETMDEFPSSSSSLSSRSFGVPESRITSLRSRLGQEVRRRLCRRTRESMNPSCWTIALAWRESSIAPAQACLAEARRCTSQVAGS